MLLATLYCSHLSGYEPFNTTACLAMKRLIQYKPVYPNSLGAKEKVRINESSDNWKFGLGRTSVSLMRGGDAKLTVIRK